MSGAGPLPVHGFVLAGGRSARMGRDKALLAFRGRPMVEIAVEKMRNFCAAVSIAGNREDLAGYAPVVREERLDAGPVAGLEAGLRACTQPWAMFLPVDVPLVPEGLLRRWAEDVLGRQNSRGNGAAPVWGAWLRSGEQIQPAFCVLRCLPWLADELGSGERRISRLFARWESLAGPGVFGQDEAARYADAAEPTLAQMEFWFSNVNTPEDLALAEAWAGRSDGTAEPLGR